MSNYSKEEIFDLILKNPSEFEDYRKANGEIDLSELDFSNMTIEGVNLTGADLSGASFNDVTFTEGLEYPVAPQTPDTPVTTGDSYPTAFVDLKNTLT